MSIAVTMLTALNPVNMPNPARIRFGCGQLWPLRPASVRNRPGSDLVLGGHVRLWPNGSGPEASRCARICRPGFGKRQPARFWQNATGPDLIWFWVAMSGCGQTDPGRKEAGVQESSGPVPANRFRAGSVAGSGPVPACLVGTQTSVAGNT